MKKTLLYLVFSIFTVTGTFAQRNCGTMDYLEMRKKQDPTLEQRMQDNEKKTQEWIRQHPDENASIKLPVIPGFSPTGNISIDRVNYEAAKKANYAKNPVKTNGNSAQQNRQVTRAEKRKNNTFISK